jgi:nicotinamide-nucleotide amidase
MPTAEIIAIGTELLLGEIQDTNTRDLAKFLRNNGIDLFRATLVGDNPERISTVIQEAVSRSNIIITTGGLGPTVDDPTRDAVALAVNAKSMFMPELWVQITARFQRYGRQPTENNRRQAYIPEGAIPVENLVGTAPAFIVEIEDKCIISLPGVPREMEYLMINNILPYLKKKYNLRGIIKACVLHTAGVGESQVDEWVSEFELLSNPTVGLLAHPGQTDVRITAKAESEEEADRMIAELLEKIRPRLGESLYGIDNVSLDQIVKEKLAKRGWRISAIECNLGGKLKEVLQKMQLPVNQVKIVDEQCTQEDISLSLKELQNTFGTEVGLGIVLRPQAEKQTLNITLITKSNGTKEMTCSWGGPPQNALLWAINTALDFTRRNI